RSSEVQSRRDHEQQHGHRDPVQPGAVHGLVPGRHPSPVHPDSRSNDHHPVRKGRRTSQALGDEGGEYGRRDAEDQKQLHDERDGEPERYRLETFHAFILPTRRGGADLLPEEEILSRLSIPGLPEGVEWEEFEGWTAGLVRAGLEAIARATGEDP